MHLKYQEGEWMTSLGDSQPLCLRGDVLWRRVGAFLPSLKGTAEEQRQLSFSTGALQELSEWKQLRETCRIPHCFIHLTRLLIGSLVQKKMQSQSCVCLGVAASLGAVPKVVDPEMRFSSFYFTCLKDIKSETVTLWNQWKKGPSRRWVKLSAAGAAEGLQKVMKSLEILPRRQEIQAFLHSHWLSQTRPFLIAFS